MFSCEFWEISMNTFFTEQLWETASVFSCRFVTNFALDLTHWIELAFTYKDNIKPNSIHELQTKLRFKKVKQFHPKKITNLKFFHIKNVNLQCVENRFKYFAGQ